MCENVDVGSCFKTLSEYPASKKRKHHGSELPGSFYAEKGIVTLFQDQLILKQYFFGALDVIQRVRS